MEPKRVALCKNKRKQRDMYALQREKMSTAVNVNASYTCNVLSSWHTDGSIYTHIPHFLERTPPLHQLSYTFVLLYCTNYMAL